MNLPDGRNPSDRGDASLRGCRDASAAERSREALRWVQIVESPDFNRWDELTEWLQGHSGNLRLYEFWIDLRGAKPIALEKLSGEND